MYMYAFGLANLPKLLSCSLNVWDHNSDVPVVVIGSTTTTGHTSLFGNLSYHRFQQYLQHNSLQKPTHTDQYLHWDSNHFITAKLSVYNTLVHRAKIVSSNWEALNKELQPIRRALQAYQFSPWALNQLQQKFERSHHSNQDSLGFSLLTPFTLPSMHLSMLSKQFRVHLSACILASLQTWRRLQ